MDKNKQLAVELIKYSLDLFDYIRELEACKPHYNALIEPRLGIYPEYAISDQELELVDKRFFSSMANNKGFRWCCGQENVADALEVLKKFQKPMRLSVRSKMIQNLEFYKAVAFWAGVTFKEESWRPETFSIVEKRDAVSTTGDLILFLERGGWRNHPGESLRLESTLRSLIADLSQPAKRDYNGPSAKQKYVLTGLAADLRRLGLSRSSHIEELISHLCTAIGFNPQIRTIGRYVKDSKSSLL